MNLAEGTLLYLPVPYWAAFVLLLYRHDLSRLSHPVRDDSSPRNWWSVLTHLGFLNQEQAVRRPGRKKEVLPYVIYLVVSLGLSLSYAVRGFPHLWYCLPIVQGISAISLTAATVQYLGSPPRRAYVDVLRFPRIGSRIRHLRKIPSTKHADNVSRKKVRLGKAGVVQTT